MRMDRQTAEALGAADGLESVYVRQGINGRYTVEVLLLEAGKLRGYTLQRTGRGGDREFTTVEAAQRELQRFWKGKFEVHPLVGEVVA